MFDFSNYSTNSKCYDYSNKLVIGRMKDEAGGVVIEEFVGLKPKMYLFLVDNKNHRIGTYEIGKISLSRFDDNIYIQKQWT